MPFIKSENKSETKIKFKLPSLELLKTPTKNSTSIYIYKEDDNGTVISNFLNTIDSVGNPIKGYIRISEKLDTNTYLVYQIKDITENIANKKKAELIFNKAIEVIAGPGHKPIKPHPAPKKIEPIISLLSNFLFVGIEKFDANTGLFLFLNK